MSNAPVPPSSSREIVAQARPGWGMLFLTVFLFAAAPALFIAAAQLPGFAPALVIAGIAALLVAATLCSGFIALQPNDSAVLILFGAYRGTLRTSGFHWVNPFYAKTRISLRARNLNGEKLKVNDLRGNPIEIAAVVVWHVSDTAQAKFDVDDYEMFVRLQSESAVRHLANQYVYDDAEPGNLTLREGGEQLLATLRAELQERVAKAGVTIDEARITHLAYAPEIAQAMLRRQQAEAIISARQKIVHGAVSMVEMALRELSEKGVVQLDEERKAAMVSNLLVVLCGESEVHPVVNTGTLHH